jgi:hypothetical protein
MLIDRDVQERLPVGSGRGLILSIFPSTFDTGGAVMFHHQTVPGLGLANVITPTSRRGLTDRAGRMPALFFAHLPRSFGLQERLPRPPAVLQKPQKPAEKPALMFL